MALPFAFARWPAALATVLLWALAAASVVFWGLRLSAPPGALAPPAVSADAVLTPDPAALARLLGGTSSAPVPAAPAAASSRFVLLGVVADSDGQGAALIAVDGKPPRPYHVGRVLADGYVLQSVSPRGASVGAGVNSASAFSLQLPVQPLATPGLPSVAPFIVPLVTPGVVSPQPAR